MSCRSSGSNHHVFNSLHCHSLHQFLVGPIPVWHTIKQNLLKFILIDFQLFLQISKNNWEHGSVFPVIINLLFHVFSRTYQLVSQILILSNLILDFPHLGMNLNVPLLVKNLETVTLYLCCFLRSVKFQSAFAKRSFSFFRIRCLPKLCSQSWTSILPAFNF